MKYPEMLAYYKRVAAVSSEDQLGEPTAEERAEIERAWRSGELLPPPWVMVELPEGPSPNGTWIRAGTYVMLRSPKVWAKRFAEEMNLDPPAGARTQGHES